MNVSQLTQYETGYQAKPFIKWAGGKRQLLGQLLANLPNYVGKYYEPFLGGGALFFALNAQRAVISDTNSELINCYRVIRARVRDLIKELQKHIYDKDYYYYIRNRNAAHLDKIERAARFIYLNRTCFNGLYRVNKSGKFNVPFGRYKDPLICNAQNLLAGSKRLQNVSIKNADFSDIAASVQKGDFVYFDPPYLPISATSNFVSYTSGGFTLAHHEQLAETFQELTQRGAFLLRM